MLQGGVKVQEVPTAAQIVQGSTAYSTKVIDARYRKLLRVRVG